MLSSGPGPFLVAMLGARRHYAVPVGLYESGLLSHFYTDAVAPSPLSFVLNHVPLLFLSDKLNRLRERNPRGIPGRLVKGFPKLAVEYSHRLSNADTDAGMLDAYLWAGRRFCELILETNPVGMTGIYAFNSASLELFQWGRDNGYRTVLDQTIAPKCVEVDLLERERTKFPEWAYQSFGGQSAESYAARERDEWTHADIILCGSEFVKESIVHAGGPGDRCEIVPYGVEPMSPSPTGEKHDGPLRVLTVGSVGLRKGSPYVVECAKRMKGRATFRMVGHVDASHDAIEEIAQYVDLKGAVARSAVLQHYKWADVFLLPSVCEGCALSCLEAMAHGLPSVVTPNTGTVVEDGKSGFIVPVGNTDAIEAALMRFVESPEVLSCMSADAYERACDFSLSSYKERLVKAIKA